MRLSAIAMGFVVLANAASAAEPKYVEAAKLNCRQEAVSSAPVVESFSRGDKLAITREVNGWSEIETPNGRTCWAVSAYLDSGERASPSSFLSSTPRAQSQSQIRALSGSAAATAPRRSSPPGAAGCPCSGSRVCVGPRGGRYCITSGGNKRYGV